MGTLTKLNEYAEMQAIKVDLHQLRKDNREQWDKSKDIKSGNMLLSAIRTRITVGRYELQCHVKTGTPPKVKMFTK